VAVATISMSIARSIDIRSNPQLGRGTRVDALAETLAKSGAREPFAHSAVRL